MDRKQAYEALRGALDKFQAAQATNLDRSLIDVLGEEVRRLCDLLDTLDKQGSGK